LSLSDISGILSPFLEAANDACLDAIILANPIGLRGSLLGNLPLGLSDGAKPQSARSTISASADDGLLELNLQSVTAVPLGFVNNAMTIEGTRTQGQSLPTGSISN
jgi:hypothetical protein